MSAPKQSYAQFRFRQSEVTQSRSRHHVQLKSSPTSCEEVKAFVQTCNIRQRRDLPINLYILQVVAIYLDRAAPPFSSHQSTKQIKNSFFYTKARRRGPSLMLHIIIIIIIIISSSSYTNTESIIAIVVLHTKSVPFLKHLSHTMNFWLRLEITLVLFVFFSYVRRGGGGSPRLVALLVDKLARSTPTPLSSPKQL